jgi:integrase
MAKTALSFNDTKLTQLPFSENGQVYYKDLERKGLYLRVGQSKKTFCIIKKTKAARTREITLGEFPALSTRAARDKALDIIREVDAGGDPVEKKKAEKTREITLDEALKQYLANTVLKENTRQKMFEKPFKLYFSELLNTPLPNITSKTIKSEYSRITEQGTVRLTAAHSLFRALRIVLNDANTRAKEEGMPIFEENPVKALHKIWVTPKPKSRILREYELPLFYKSLVNRIAEYKDIPELSVAAEYLLFVFFSGCRRTEAIKLKWSDVDFDHLILTFRDTKTADKRVIPISDVLKTILDRRARYKAGIWVFPGRQSKSGHLEDPKSTLNKVLEQMNKLSGTEIERFSVHDLRRTFITYAKFKGQGANIDAAVDIIVGHKGQDVSRKHYQFPTPETLMEPMNGIDKMLLDLGRGSISDLIL